LNKPLDGTIPCAYLIDVGSRDAVISTQADTTITFYAQSPTMPTPFSTLPPIPKTVTGFHRRFKADTRLIAIHEDHKPQLF
jgi:hypothetical protein